MSSKSPRLRQPGKQVFPQPKPQLTLVKPIQEHKPMSEFSPAVKEMLREIRRRQSKKGYPDAPDAA